MPTLFNRYAAVHIGDLRVEGLHVRFKAKKGSDADPNSLELLVYNLSESTRAKIPATNVPIILIAGYTGTSEVIFSGDARTVDHVRRGPDWETHIRCGDGEKRYQASYSAKSFGPGTTLETVIEALADDLGVDAGDALSKLGQGDPSPEVRQFIQGFSAQGRTVRVLDKVTKAANIEWHIQDGALVLLAPGQTSTEEAVYLSPQTGLLGSPEHGKPARLDEKAYLKVKCLLNGGIRPGRAIQLDSAYQKNRTYRAEKVEHTGDSISVEDWCTEAWCVPVNT